MKILITGGSGFVGRNLVEHLARHHEIAAPSRIELDLLSEPAVSSYLAAHRFDAVIHAAAAGVSRRLDPGAGSQIFAHNCRMFFNLARNTGAFGQMLFLSSGAVYDRTHARQVSENDFDLHVPPDDYGFSKYVCAKAIQAMDRVYELRLFGLFGRYEDWQVRFISNTCCRALWDLPVIIRRNTRFDYLDVEDLCSIVESCLDKKLAHRQYNVCRGAAFELKTLAEKIVELSGGSSGQHVPVSVETEDLTNEYSGDNSRLLREFPDLKFREIDESLNRLYRWYEARKAEIDPSLLRFDG